MSFMMGLRKIAVEDMSAQAKVTATAPMQDGVPGEIARETMTTGQPRKKNTRTYNVYNEGREMNPKLKHDANEARFGGGKKAPDQIAGE
jgi:hypothetical protein